MARSAGEDAQVAVERELRDGESLVGLVPALAPHPDTGGGGLLPAWVIPVIWAVERWRWHRSSRQLAVASMFPLAPRMFIAATDRRLLIWRSRRRWRFGGFLGYVTLDRIVRADAPTVGAGWRSVRIFLANEPTLTVRVPSKSADSFARFLTSGRPDGDE